MLGTEQLADSYLIAESFRHYTVFFRKEICILSQAEQQSRKPSITYLEVQTDCLDMRNDYLDGEIYYRSRQLKLLNRHTDRNSQMDDGLGLSGRGWETVMYVDFRNLRF